MRLFDIYGRRQHFVVQRQHGLDQAGCTGRRFGMPDLRFDAAQGDVLPPGVILTKELVQRGCFTQIAGHSSGAMRLDQANRGRRDSGALIRTAQG